MNVAKIRHLALVIDSLSQELFNEIGDFLRASELESLILCTDSPIDLSHSPSEDLSQNHSKLGLQVPKTAVYSGINEDLRGEGAMGDFATSLIVEKRAYSLARQDLLAKFKDLLINSDEADLSALLPEDLERVLTEGRKVDLIIKVGLEDSLDNSLIIESAYAEIYFATMKAEDFTLTELIKAFEDFSLRQRNFGL